MKALIVVFAVVILVDAQLNELNAAIGDFSIRLLQASINDKEAENSIHSAYSISSALGMCLLGAEGTTFDAMKNALSLSALTDDDIKDGYTASSQALSAVFTSSGRGFVVSKANRVYVNNSYPVGNAFRTQVQDVFAAEFENVDFANDREPIKNEINSFVSNTTHGLIPELLENALDAGTVMAVINALYFNGTWSEEFDEVDDSRTFNSHVGSGQPATWLRSEQHMLYGESSELEATLVSVPYQRNSNSDDQASMLIILPNEKHKTQINNWIRSRVTWEAIASAVGSMASSSVLLTFPKVDVESSVGLADILKNLGMSEAFSDKANFNRIVDSGPAGIKIDDVIHKAKITVDEFGTAAAAATIVTFKLTSASVGEPPRSIELFVDRSYIAFIILKQKDDSIVPLFTSVINKLTK